MNWKDFLPLDIRKIFMDKIYGRFIFSNFGKAKFDSESWRMITPEIISKNLAKNFYDKFIFEPFAGIGGNTIQFGLYNNKVLAIEKDKKKYKYLVHNCKIYGVEKNIEFINEDCFEYVDFHKKSRFDLVYLDPPFALLEELLKLPLPIKTKKIRDLKTFWHLAPLKILKIPRDFKIEKLLILGQFELKKIYLNKNLFYMEAWFRDNKFQENDIEIKEEFLEM